MAGTPSAKTNQKKRKEQNDMSAQALETSGQLLDELENAMNDGPIGRRVDTLRRVTDLFLVGTSDYSDEQTELFDDVFACLVQKIDVAARAMLSTRLAPHRHAPPRIVHKLAFDDAISVAGPILTLSPRLDDSALTEIARSKSQQHLLAISKRPSLAAQVTEVLVDRGDQDVVHSTVLNNGARFSDTGFSRLIERADGHDDLAVSIGQRPGIPRHHLVRLMARASENVRAKLRAEYTGAVAEVSDAVRTATTRVHQKSAESAEVLAAITLVRELDDKNLLNESRVSSFARDNRSEETCAALAQLLNAPYTEIEAVMAEERAEGVMILGKVLGFSWDNLKTILHMRARLLGRPIGDEALSRASYERLRPATAQQVLRFQKMQRIAADTSTQPS